ncbi:MAG: glycosyltransferase family 4 protein [Phycisphaerales bacterium]|nr:glycosyltransferase family 4 protein [Phycisphaerales bacterium]
MSDARGICFVALNGYAALAGRGGVEHVGGAEQQMALLARELARRGRAVSFITRDVGQGDGASVNGVRVWKAYADDGGWPGLRFFHPRLSGLWSAMRRADADVYYQRMAEQTTGIVAAFCARKGRRFVYAAASDYDCMSALPRLRKLRERCLYRYGLRRAHVVLAQTRSQCALLRESFGVRASVLANASEDLSDVAVDAQGCRDSPSSRNDVLAESNPGGSAAGHSDRNAKRPRILWVGRFTPEKRLSWALEAARQCPKMDFGIVGDGADALMREAREAARPLQNVTLLGRIPHERMRDCYVRADLLLCTSEREGFPNTFLEAWSLGLPVVTTFDPDGVVAGERLGAAAGDVKGLSGALRALVDDAKEREACRRRCRCYFEKHHGVASIVDQLEALAFSGATGPPSARG